MLDLLAGSGLSWATASILFERLTGQRLDEADIAATKDARMFWTVFSEGRARYAALVKIKEVKLWRGDFGYFDCQQLHNLLPGVILADHFERRQFLVSFTREEEASADLYTITYQPLCRHPFPAKFNPLIFGRPKLHQ